jgi:hypothetical protein
MAGISTVYFSARRPDNKPSGEQSQVAVFPSNASLRVRGANNNIEPRAPVAVAGGSGLRSSLREDWFRN